MQSGGHEERTSQRLNVGQPGTIKVGVEHLFLSQTSGHRRGILLFAESSQYMNKQQDAV